MRKFFGFVIMLIGGLLLLYSGGCLLAYAPQMMQLENILDTVQLVGLLLVLFLSGWYLVKLARRMMRGQDD